MAGDGAFADIAAAIADGAAIDWKLAESGVSEADRPLLARLKQVATLAALHRSFATAAPGAGEVAVGADASVRRWGRLLLLDRLGAGAFGEVFRAWDENLDREVALKLLPVPTHRRDADSRTILEEGRVLARVRHPNVVTIYGAEVIEDRIGLWMELVEGRTLEQALAEGKRFGPREVVSIGIELCGAVAAVHGAGLLHRDVKASNVMVANDGRLVLMDFGTGQNLDDSGSSLAGTPLYLAPELFAGSEPTTASDVYSIGVVLFRLLTGSYPLTAEDLDGLRAAHGRGERHRVRAALPEAPERLARVIDRALEPHPARRHPTAAALAADLAEREHPRTRGAVWIGSIAAAGLLAALLFLWTLRDQPGAGDDSSSNGPPPASVGSGGAAIVGPAADTDLPVIVVLPFDNVSARPEDGSFVDGLTDEILRDLARVDGLAVRSRYSSFTFREQPRDLSAIASRLDADLAVTGSVARTADRLRIQVQLVDLARDRPLWADRFDRKLESTGDLFAVVDEIARGIVNQLRLTLGTGQRRYDVDLDVYERYLDARQLVGRRGVHAPVEAMGMLQQILDEDASFAPAHAALVEALAFQSIPTYQAGITPAQALERMRAAAKAALQLDPLLAEAHAAMGIVQARDREWSRAEQSFERALELDSTLTDVYTNYSLFVLRPLGRTTVALRLLGRAQENDPLSLYVEVEIADICFIAGRYQEAIDRLERIQALDPDFPYVLMNLGRAMIFDGRVDEGLALLDQDATRGPTGRRLNGHYRSHGLIRQGRREEVERLLVDAVEGGRPYHELVIQAALGNLDGAFDALERTEAAEPHRVPLFLSYPELDALRGDPRFAAFRRRVGLSETGP